MRNLSTSPLYSRISLFLLGWVLLTGSCKKAVTVELPADYLVAGAVFNTDRSAQSAMAGIYSQLSQGNLQACTNGITLFAGLLSDELTTPATGAYEEFVTNSLSVSNTVLQSNLWASLYKSIYQTNALLEGLASSTGVSAPVRQQLSGEARLLRAYFYFYLVRLFGDVPLVTGTDYRINAVKERTPTAEVYAQIKEDLQAALTNLPAAYPATGRSRPNQWTAAAFLARVSLFMNDPTTAAQQASAIIQSGVYSLSPSTANVFLATSNETLWQLVPVQPNYNTWDGNLFISNAGIIPSYTVSPGLLAAFENGDQRKTQWLKNTTVNSVVYTHPFKYKVKTSATVTENQVMLRLAEVYLIRAEARLLLGDLTGARDDLNLVRNRAGLGASPAMTSPAIATAIRQERRVELFAEWGHRWFDLQRSGQIDAVMSAAKPGLWQPTDALCPIPQSEILRNVNLTQNPGY